MGLPPAALCPECCECPQPKVEWDSCSASKTKCGYAEFPGHVSTPPKIYSTLTVSGSWSYTFQTGEIVGCDPCCDPVDCLDSQTFTQAISGGYTYDSDCSPVGSAELDSSFSGCESGGSTTPLSSTDAYNFYTGPLATITSTTREANRTSPVEGDCSDQGFSDTTKAELTAEYTTANLLTNTLAALPAFDGDWDDTAGSYANTTTDELTRSIRESRYRITFTVPKVGSGTCYKVTWIERFTPAVGSVVDTPRCAIWDGTLLVAGTGLIGDGSNPYFSVPIPSTNGTTTVVDVVAVCRGCGTPC